MSQQEKNINTIENLEATSAEKTSPPHEENSVDELQQALAAKTEEWKDLNDRYLRAAAEFENSKRLAQRDQRDQIRFANEQLIKELLPVVDNLERALKAAKEGGNGEGLIQGVDLTLKQLMNMLTKFGVQLIPTVGQPFDPTSHQAVMSVASPKIPANHVAEEFQRGYRLHDRILRAAMVSVSTGTDNTTNSEDELSD
ncbi:MAG TPA: nucleotide exchange factor GrpE [Nitrospiraceae bacterium]